MYNKLMTYQHLGDHIGEMDIHQKYLLTVKGLALYNALMKEE